MAVNPKLKLNEDQKAVFKGISWFLNHPAADTLVLLGYAGTGKTFLMQFLAQWLDEKEKAFILLASTGRAATVLRGKTGYRTRTVHSELYHFQTVEGDDDNIPDDASIDQFGQMKLLFNLRQPDQEKKLYIIDEASMLSNEISYDALSTQFGSGYLLSDFFNAIKGNKVIFVGDPCQLPPVNMVISPALERNWLTKLKRTVIELTLKEVVRQRKESEILKLSSYIRYLTGLSNVPDRPPLVLPPKDGKVNNEIRLYSNRESLLENYYEFFTSKANGNCIAIARTNRETSEINQYFRNKLYGSPVQPLQVNDLLLVTQNNYKVPLTNGDFVQVVSLGEIRSQANMKFQSVIVKALLSETEYQLLLSLDVLNSGRINLSPEQHRDLMIDFTRRMRNNKVRPKTDAYKSAMMNDDFLNCLRATYGYAVTCHKAQGGEWDDVFLFLSDGMYKMPKAGLFRWWYTAITRAKVGLHLENNFWIQTSP